MFRLTETRTGFLAKSAALPTAVSVADQWKTYVTTHAFTDQAVRMAVDNGVKMVEHVPFIFRIIMKDGVIHKNSLPAGAQ